MVAIDFTAQTTIVTGASSGIGAAFARALAKRGSDVILVARRLDRLQELASELEREHGVRATAIALDLGVHGAGQALAAEVAARGLTLTGLRVVSLAPGLTRTEFFDDLAGGAYNGSYQTPEQVVETGMRSLDRGNHRPSVVSGRRNALVAGLGRFFTRRRAVLLSGSFGASSRGTAAAAPAPANR